MMKSSFWRFFKRFVVLCFMALCIIPGFADNITTSPANCNSATLNTATGPATLNADWEANKINIAWYKDGEKITNDANAATQCTYDQTFSLPTPPTKTGYNFAGWKAMPVPSIYTQLEYIESTGTQYINTNYVLTENDEVEVDYTLTNLSNTGDKMIIAQQVDNNKGMWVETYGNTNQWYVRFGSTASVNAAFQNSQTSGTFIIKKGSFSINGTKILSPSYSGMSTYPMTIFGRLDSSGNLQYPAYIQIGGVRIKNNGTMVHNYVPARRNSDGVLGMYDTVTGQFYTNAGSGSFTAGPAVQ